MLRVVSQSNNYFNSVRIFQQKHTDVQGDKRLRYSLMVSKSPGRHANDSVFALFVLRRKRYQIKHTKSEICIYLNIYLIAALFGKKITTAH